MKKWNVLMFAAAMAGLTVFAVEQPAPASTPAAEPTSTESCGSGCPSFEWPPRIGIYISDTSAASRPGTVGISLTGVSEGEYFGGIGFGFFGEDFSRQSDMEV